MVTAMSKRVAEGGGRRREEEREREALLCETVTEKRTSRDAE